MANTYLDYIKTVFLIEIREFLLKKKKHAKIMLILYTQILTEKKYSDINSTGRIFFSWNSLKCYHNLGTTLLISVRLEDRKMVDDNVRITSPQRHIPPTKMRLNSQCNRNVLTEVIWSFAQYMRSRSYWKHFNSRLCISPSGILVKYRIPYTIHVLILYFPLLLPLV